MQVSQIIKTEEGEFKFEGTLSQEEHDFLIEFSLNMLVAQGAIPFKMAQEMTADVAPGSEKVN